MRRPIRRAARRPFGRLVGHFLARLVRGGQDGASPEYEFGAGGLLGLLAAPGAINCFLLFDKYSSLLNWMRGRRSLDVFVTSVPDKYLYISLAMAICGIVTVLKWDHILPDSQDYLNLAPLPIRARTIFLANASAILIAVTIMAIDVNAMPAVLLPSIVAASGHLSTAASMQFVAVHWLCVGLASIFATSVVFALLGTLSALLPRAVFRACSWWVRGVLLLAFVTMLLTGFMGSALVRRVEQFPDSAIQWLPSLWYLGLYQSLQDRATPALAKVAGFALKGAGIACAVMAISYGLSYRRRFAAVLESGRKPAARYAIGLVFLDWFARGASGFQRGCHHFVVRALLRSETHRLTIAVSIGLGWLMVFQMATGRAAAVALTEAPLIAAYLLILGLRVAFELPAAAPANWIFQTILDLKENPPAPVARRVMLGFLVPLILVPSFAAAWWYWGIAAAALHCLYEMALCWSLMGLMLMKYRKLPLTCPMPGFRDNFLMLCLIQLVGLAVFAASGARLERWMLRLPPRFLLVPAVMLAAWYWNRRRIADARKAGELEEGLVFENALPRAVERLYLSDGV